MSNLTQFSGFRDFPLRPDASEPGFATSGYSQQPIYVYNQSQDFMAYYDWVGGEMSTSSVFNANWNSAPSSTGGWTYSGTTLTGMHGHLFANVVTPINSNATGQFYLNGNNQNPGTFYGCLNSQATGVWVNKTKRDNLCIQRANNPSDYGDYFSRTQISTVGYGAYFAPITSTLAFSGYGSGVANGYDTSRSYGCIGYNETTKMWAVTGAANSSSGCTIFVYKNINPPTLANTNNQTFWNQFNHSTKITITFTFPGYNDTHDYQHYKIIPLDNGNIGMVVKNASSAIYYYLFTGNDGVNSTSWTGPTTLFGISTTTSYHDSQFTTHDFLPAMMSPDGKYVFVWTQYYYYQAGLCGYAIRVSDGQCKKINWSDTTYAYSPVFLQDNNLFLGYGVNSDSGRGMALYSYNLEDMFARYPTDGQSITSAVTEFNVEKPYTSTDYPMIWQQNNYMPNFVRGVF